MDKTNNNRVRRDNLKEFGFTPEKIAEIESKIVKFVKENEELYNFNHPLYSSTNSAHKKNLWKRFGRTLNPKLTNKQCSIQWSKIKNRYSVSKLSYDKKIMGLTEEQIREVKVPDIVKRLSFLSNVYRPQLNRYLNGQIIDNVFVPSIDRDHESSHSFEEEEDDKRTEEIENANDIGASPESYGNNAKENENRDDNRYDILRNDFFSFESVPKRIKNELKKNNLDNTILNPADFIFQSEPSSSTTTTATTASIATTATMNSVVDSFLNDLSHLLLEFEKKKGFMMLQKLKLKINTLILDEFDRK